MISRETMIAELKQKKFIPFQHGENSDDGSRITAVTNRKREISCFFCPADSKKIITTEVDGCIFTNADEYPDEELVNIQKIKWEDVPDDVLFALHRRTFFGWEPERQNQVGYLLLEEMINISNKN